MKRISTGSRDGIKVTYYPTTEKLRINGWYDGMVGIEGFEMSLTEFFNQLGITYYTVRRIFRRQQRNSQ